MNIFYVDRDPGIAARSLPDKHIVKMPVETVQMLVSVLVRHGIEHSVMTQKGTLHKGGYANHPCTVWAGDTRANAKWLYLNGVALCEEYTKRYEKHHAAEKQLAQIRPLLSQLPDGLLTPPALAMPDECKTIDPVESYRAYIRLKVKEKPSSFVWAKSTPAPEWL